MVRAPQSAPPEVAASMATTRTPMPPARPTRPSNPLWSKARFGSFHMALLRASSSVGGLQQAISFWSSGMFGSLMQSS